jgi:hypothetical protein
MEQGRIHTSELDNNEAGVLKCGLLTRAHLKLLSSGSILAVPVATCVQIRGA